MPDKSEREKMLSGELYDASDPDLRAARVRARRLCRMLNNAEEEDERWSILLELLGGMGEGVSIQPPFYCDYGCHIFLGNRVYMNYNCVILDCAEVRIGDDVMFGPNVQIYPATHPIDPMERTSGPELAHPVTIGSRVWVGGGAIILPGVTIGENSTVGAGAVVTRDVPPNVVVAGNPARIIRHL